MSFCLKYLLQNPKCQYACEFSWILSKNVILSSDMKDIFILVLFTIFLVSILYFYFLSFNLSVQYYIKSFFWPFSNLLYCCIAVSILKNTFVATQNMNSSVNCGLGVIRMCQCKFVNCDKCTTLVGMLIMGEVIVMWRGARRYIENLYLFLSL